jgi:hypothetical protein
MFLLLESKEAALIRKGKFTLDRYYIKLFLVKLQVLSAPFNQ